ncbi:hypothetical protein GCM10010840_31230 [Deinococcus aerolatus]|uniref:DUF3084 domain-containing protein n=1 Tax=Deinococcus aerolatus TaxID=522487 RepID=A0ABQ2GEI2_9DEIO|nr:DUF3084 domain-containing protein [Deinococcus aerolatus]GGL90933.1 hypothetical protein GCM10010840_31230 [Deinococcus aerolatus]
MLWLFLPFVVVLSGVVAYAADTIARKAGRKHIRLFGLRPKTTALLVAVLSGMAISAASLAAFLLLNRSAVATIAEADQLRPRIESLRKEVGAVQGELKSVQQERDQAQREADRSAQLQAQAEERLRQTRSQLEAARTAEKTLREEAKTLQGQVDEQTATLRTLEERAAENRKKLAASETALKASRARAQTLDSQVVELNTRVALAEQEAQSAQERADGAQATAQAEQDRAVAAQATAQAEQNRALTAQATAAKQVKAAQASVAQARRDAAAQIKAAGKQVTDLKAQVSTLEQSRKKAAVDLATAQAAARSAQQVRDQLGAERDRLSAQRDTLVADQARVTRERDQAARERAQATADRDKVRRDLTALQQQQRQLQASNDELKNSNDSLARALADARASLGKLQDENLSSRTELSASRNTDLAYPKNELVYAAVVPGVRNLDQFLRDAAASAQLRGARGTGGAPSVRLSGGARTVLETKLRGLNVSTFVQCRAAQNAAVGFPVDLSCDARPNTVLYRGGEVIRRVNVTLSSDPRAMQDQISDLVKDAVTDITARGVPSEYILNKGLDVSELVTLLDRLGKRSGSTAVVGVAAREDVRPSMRVDLYPVLP